MKQNKNFVPFTDWAVIGFPTLTELHKDFKSDTGSDLNLRNFIIGMYTQCVHYRSKAGKQSYKEAANTEWLRSVYEEHKANPKLRSALMEIVELPKTPAL